MSSSPSSPPDAPTVMRLKKVTYTIEVLMAADDNPETEVDQLHENINTGDWSGGPLQHQETLLIGTDLAFFFPDDLAA